MHECDESLKRRIPLGPVSQWRIRERLVGQSRGDIGIGVVQQSLGTK
jgi:hypothetical protein